MDQAKRQVLIGKIAEAFADTPYPENGYIGSGLQEFEGQNWRTLPIALLRKYRDELFFTPQGFRYFLPAILIGIITNPKELDILVDNFIYALSPLSEGHRKVLFLQNVAVLSRKEKVAVYEFLCAYEEFEPHSDLVTSEWEKPVLVSAIEYWENEVKNIS